MSGIEPYLPRIKKLEGFTPKSTWDYKQNSWGYGTKAPAPGGGEITPEQADADLRRELGQAAGHVDRFAPGLPEGKRAALASLTFNAGPGWQSKGLGQAVKAGDWDTAAQRFAQYNKVTNPDGTMAELPGLTNRRRTELSWWGQDGARPQMSIMPRLIDPGPAPTSAPIAPEMQALPTEKRIDEARDVGKSYLAQSMRAKPNVTQAGMTGVMQGLAHVADVGANAWLGREWMEQARADEDKRQAGANGAFQSLAGLVSGRGASVQPASAPAYTSAASVPVERSALPPVAGGNPEAMPQIMPALGRSRPAIADGGTSSGIMPAMSGMERPAIAGMSAGMPAEFPKSTPPADIRAPAPVAGKSGNAANRMSEDEHNKLQMQVLSHPAYQHMNPQQQKVLGLLMAQAAPEKEEIKLDNGSVLAVSKSGVRELARFDKPTGNMQDYESHKRQEEAAGRVPESFKSYQESIKRAGVPQPENTFNTAAAKTMVGRHEKVIEAGDTSRSFRQQLDLLREQSDSFGNQGSLATLKETIGPMATALGVKLDGLNEIQAFTSVIQKMAPTMRAPGSGSTSDIEFKGFLAALPQASGTAEGRRMIMDQLSSVAKDAEARAEISSRVLSGEIDRKDAERVLRELPDPMAYYREYRKASGAGKPQTGQEPIAVATPEEARKLPSGTPIKLPDGTIGRVP